MTKPKFPVWITWKDRRAFYFGGEELPAPMTRAQELEVGRKAFAGDRDAQDLLVLHNLRFSVKIATGYKGTGLPDDDLVQYGAIGLIEASRRFDPDSYDNRFITYAVWWIRVSVQKAIAEQGRTLRMPYNREMDMRKVLKAQRELGATGGGASVHELSDATGLKPLIVEYLLACSTAHASLDVPLRTEGKELLLGDTIAHDCPTPEDDMHRAQTREVIDRALAQLPARTAQVVRRNFGLDTDAPESLDAIGRDLRLSRERVRQLRNEGLDLLRRGGRWETISELQGVGA